MLEPQIEPQAALWHEPAPKHVDSRLPCWLKALLIIAAACTAIVFVDAPTAAWALRTHLLPDLTDLHARHGDPARELMMLEQWGQWTASVLVIAAVALLDRAGRRRALAIAIGCLITVAVTYLLKDLIGRTRPYAANDPAFGLEPGQWIWGGPRHGFGGGAIWNSFPSAHTTGAFALSTGLAWFYPRGRGLFMLLAVGTAAQRVLHSAHFVSDVIAGMGLAVFIVRLSLSAKLAGRVMALGPPALVKWWVS